MLGAGTSFAAPLVSGAVAARLQRDGVLDPWTCFGYLAESGLPLDGDAVFRMGLFGPRMDADDFLAVGALY